MSNLHSNIFKLILKVDDFNDIEIDNLHSNIFKLILKVYDRIRINN